MKNVIIIGAATGIGAACLRLLKGRGCSVTALDVAAVPDADHYLHLDLKKPAEAAQIAETLAGPVDAIICNAGLPPRPGNAAELLTVNVIGLLAVANVLLPKLARSGSLTFTASRVGSRWREHMDEIKALLSLPDPAGLEAFIAAREITPGRAYFLSKETLIFWCKKQAAEAWTRNGVRINSVSPAPVETPILDDFLKVFGERAKDTMTRVGRAASPEEIAEVLCFAASAQSSWLNAQDIILDGGDSGFKEAELYGRADEERRRA